MTGMLLKLFWRTVRDAAWPGLVVLVSHTVLGEVFGHEPYVDPAMHFAGGMAAAFFFTRLPRLLPDYFGDPTPTVIGLLGIGLTSTVAVLWELGEFLSDVYLGTHIQRSVGNTMRDLVNGMVGGGVLVIGERLFRTDPRRTGHGAPHDAGLSQRASRVARNRPH
jgi:hypothetical protein